MNLQAVVSPGAPPRIIGRVGQSLYIYMIRTIFTLVFVEVNRGREIILLPAIITSDDRFHQILDDRQYWPGLDTASFPFEIIYSVHLSRYNFLTENLY